jgi:hypothetical protein
MKASKSSPYYSKLPAVDRRKHANSGAISRNETPLPDIYAPAGPSGPLSPDRNAEKKVSYILRFDYLQRL